MGPSEGSSALATEEPAALPPPSALAAQASRDVEALRRLDAAGGAQVAAADSTAPPPQVRWTVLPGWQQSSSSPDPQPPLAIRPAGGDGGPRIALPPDEPPPQRPQAPPDLQSGGLDQASLGELVAQLSRQLRREAATSDVPLRELVMAAATALLDPDRPLDPSAMPGLGDDERRILSRMVELFGGLGRRLAEGGDPAAVASLLRAAADSVGAPPPLRVGRALLCTRVRGFGDYDELPRNAQGRYVFLAHSGQRAIVYVEVENYGSDQNAEGVWVTELGQQLTIYTDRDGLPVWGGGAYRIGVDRSRTRRDDFFIVQVITPGERLAVGRYQLKVRLRDEKSGAEAESAVGFEMVADPALAP
jgi:hypothetical protein